MSLSLDKSSKTNEKPQHRFSLIKVEVFFYSSRIMITATLFEVLLVVALVCAVKTGADFREILSLVMFTAKFAQKK